jgi:multiple antibiotic resistance protein
MLQTLHDFLSIFIPLLVVIDPAGTVPVYLALTEHHNEKQRRRIAFRATTVAAATGIAFIILGQAIFNFLGVRFADFQIAGGILLVILSIIDLLTPGKPAVNENAPLDPSTSIGVVPLAVPLIVGPATLTTTLLLVNTYSAAYNERFGPPHGTMVIVTMVIVALLLNLLLLFAAMWWSSRLVALLGKNTLAVVNKIVMILLAAFAVSLIRQGIVSIVLELRHPG